MNEDKRTIYFDNCATTSVYAEAADKMRDVFISDYGNPSSMHMMGVEAENHVKASAEIIAGTLGVKPGEIFFTSGGTESNNWAILGAANAMKRRGKHIITSMIEHPSVSETMKYLESEGFEVTCIGLDENGEFDLEALSDSIREDTILVSLIMVNNETGIVTPWEQIGKLIKSKNPDTIYHGDGVQAYGKYAINPRKASMDLMSVSAHKIHGPKGAGFLYKSADTRILPLIRGGGQQQGMRSGTDNVPGIAGLGVAADMIYSLLDKNTETMYALKEHLIAGLKELPDVVIHTKEGRESAPHIVNASFTGVGSEVLLHSLEDRGIYVSAGSACSTHKKSKSPTLSALNATKAELDSTIRISFCESNTTEEVDIMLEALQELLPILRRYKPH